MNAERCMQNDVLEQLKKFDTNAEQLYDKVLKAVGVTVDRKTGEIFQDKAWKLLFSFGIPDLLARLESQQTIETRRHSSQDAIARARIWRHIAEASKPMQNPKQGEGSISDITDNCQLNAWLPDDSEKFTREMPARKCDSCGKQWDMCENHLTKDGTQQTDTSKSWFCFWCFREPVVRSAYGIKESSAIHNSEVAVWTKTDEWGWSPIENRPVKQQRGACILCKIPWEGIGVGGHVPVKESETDWVCGHCVRQNSALVVGSSVVLKPSDLPKKPRAFKCCSSSCGTGRDDRGNRVRGIVEHRGDYCSKTCKKTAKLAQKDALRRNPPAVVKPEAISAVAQMPENTIEA